MRTLLTHTHTKLANPNSHLAPHENVTVMSAPGGTQAHSLKATRAQRWNRRSPITYSIIYRSQCSNNLSLCANKANGVSAGQLVIP